MSNELRGATAPGMTCYAMVLNSAGKFWDTVTETFVSFDTNSYSDYLITMLEQGSTGIYLGDFPVTITSSGTYEYFIKRQSDASPAQDDPIVNTGKLDWTGSSIVSALVGSMSGSDWLAYVLRGGFKRTDKSVEVYEETTDAIQEMRRRFMFDEAEEEKTTTDTISVLGDFKLDVEDDFGLLLGIVIEDGQNATPLIQLTKDEFNSEYPDINVTNDRGYPKHFSIYNGVINLGPIPDQVSYSYRKSYSSRAGIITATSVGVPFTRDYRDILRDNVQSRLYKIMDEFDKSAAFRQAFEIGFNDATSRERTNAGTGFFYVKPFGM